MRFWMFVVSILALLVLLKWQFPYAAGHTDQVMHMVYLVALLLLIASGWSLRTVRLSQAVKYAAIWLGLILLLVFAYSFRDQLTRNRLMAELMPNRLQVTSEGALTVRSAQDGHFHIEAEINGAPVDFIVDTGASDIVLSPSDAARAGFDTDALNYNRTYHTANGVVGGAPVRLERLAVGSIMLRDVPASVNRADMEESLLGMAFLNRLGGYSVEGNTLTLRPQ